MDNQATTPVDERVLAAMWPYFREQCGNAASRSHAYGWAAEDAVAQARQEVAALLGARPKDIVFTSGATESDNLAIKGVVEAYQDLGNHVVTCVTEHKAVLDTCQSLERAGRARVTYLPVDAQGRVDPEDVRHALTDQTILVSIMAANNEVGTLQPIREIGRIAKARGVLFHCDATQAAGKLPIDVARDGLDLLSMSAHKIYGPKGCGALYVRGSQPRVRLLSQMDGGGHERGLRSGTLNVPGIVGFGKACELCRLELDAEAGRLSALRATLHDALTRELDGVFLNGHPTERIPGNLSLSFSGLDGEALLSGVTTAIAVSSGSACTSATVAPSYVLKALGVGDDLALATIRFGLGRFNTPADVDLAVARVVHVVRRLRAH